MTPILQRALLNIVWVMLLSAVTGYCNKLTIVKEREDWKSAAGKCADDQSKHLLGDSIMHNQADVSSALEQLKDGESAWIGGYTELSPFVSWMGCSSRKPGQTYSLTNNNIFNCYKKCVEKEAPKAYIGLQTDTCFCSQYDFRGSVDDSFCNLTCQGSNTLENCGAINYTAVYTVSEAFATGFNDMFPKLEKKQCIYIKNVHNEGLKAFSGSCFNRSTVVYGYLCTDKQVHSEWDCEDGKTTGTGMKPCVFSLQPGSNSWDIARENCRSKSGILADLRYGLQLDTLSLQASAWTGLFRTMKTPITWSDSVHSNDKSDTACIVVTRIKDSLKIETDSCTNERFYACGQSTTNTHESSTSGIGSEETNKVTLPPGKNTQNKEHFNYMYLILALICVLVIVIIIVIVVNVRLRLNNRRRILSNRTSRTPAAAVDNEEYYSTIEESGTVKYKTTGTSKKEYESQQEDYDRIEFKTKYRPQRQSALAVPEGSHIYDHTNQTTESDYDNVLSGNARQKGTGVTPSNNMKGEQGENIYHHLGKDDENDYNTLKSTQRVLKNSEYSDVKHVQGNN